MFGKIRSWRVTVFCRTEYFFFQISQVLSFAHPALTSDAAEVPVWDEKLPVLDHSCSWVFSLCHFGYLFWDCHSSSGSSRWWFDFSCSFCSCFSTSCSLIAGSIGLAAPNIEAAWLDWEVPAKESSSLGVLWSFRFGLVLWEGPLLSYL